ncbi:MAG: pilus assembly protein PilZ, partial [Chloroflexi bacterium]|nr:pilus assembly protein PilZ [Chloroflexota bacterium]
MRFKRLLSNPLKSTRGQVLPAVLAIMVVGGLAIGPSLSFMGSALNSGKLIEARVGEIYAADAGMEHGLWTLKNSPPAEY